MSKEQYEHLIVRQPLMVSDLPDHKRQDMLPFPIMMAKDLVPEANAWAMCMFVKKITQELIDSLELFKSNPHKHDFDEMYLMIGDPGAITFEVMLGDELYELETPGSVYVPAGLAHTLRPIKATVGSTGGFIPVYLNGTYTTLPV